MKPGVAILLVATGMATAAPPRQAGGESTSAIVEAKTAGYSAARGIVAISAGRSAGVSLGDRFWIVAEGNAIGSGEVFFVDETGSAGRLTVRADAMKDDQPVAVLSGRRLQSVRDRLPEGATIHTTLTRLPPGRKTAWLDCGVQGGLREGDQILVERQALPIARGRITAVESDSALATLSPLVGNTLPEAGDHAALWPAPACAATGALNSTVLDVQPDAEGAILLIAGSPVDGLVPGRSVDLFRRGKYVGFGWIMDAFDPLSRVRAVESASPEAPLVGDQALVRARPEPGRQPLSAAVFRIEGGDYCLLAAGESDGVTLDEVFVIRRGGTEPGSPVREVAELIVEAVKVDYSGARIRLLRTDEPPPALWEFAERRSPAHPHCVPIGIVERVKTEDHLAWGEVDPRCSLAPGSIVRLVPEGDQPIAAGIVVHVNGGQAMICIPPGWGEAKDLVHAGIQVSAKVTGAAGVVPPSSLPSP